MNKEVAAFILGGAINALHNILLEIADIVDSAAMLERIGTLPHESLEHVLSLTQSMTDQANNLDTYLKDLDRGVED